jgi:flap endonuclease-1
MGLQIGDIVPKKEIRLEDLKGKTIAVDAFNALYQFLANIRQMDGTPLMDSKKRITSHLSGLFYRTTNLMNLGIRLIYVFDGKPPELKEKTVEARIERKKEAKEKYEEAREKGSEEEMYKWSKQTLHLTDEMVEEAKALLDALGIPVVQAPSEGEAQASFIASEGDAYAVASQDYDALLFGAPVLIQNVTLAKKRRTPAGAYVSIAPSMIELNDLLKTLDIGRDQLICLGILTGTDFNPKGIKGIGPKKALQLVKIYKDPELLFRALEKQVQEGKIPKPEFEWHEIFDIFKKPDVTARYRIESGKINEDKVRQVLCKEHDFSEERVDSALAKLRQHEKEKSQKDLKKWF